MKKSSRHNRLIALVAGLATVLLLAVGCDDPAAAAPSAPTTLTMQIKGMTCAGCSGAIAETIQPMPGVTAVSVNHETGQAVITYASDDPAFPNRLASTINELGFEASPTRP